MVIAKFTTAVWSLITTNSLEEVLLKTVNLGDDAYTVTAIAGGLAGLFYGYEKIPEQWKRTLIMEEELVETILL